MKEQAPVEKPSQAVMAEKVQSVYMPFYGVFGTATLEEMIAHATIIVRATFDSVRPVGVRSIDTYDTESKQFDGYHGSLEFTFNVLEYLKGTGGNQMKGIAHGWPTHLSKPYTVIAATEAEAATLARGLLTHWDTRWDDHEAIVIFRNPPVWSESHLAAQLDYLWLGELSLFEDQFARESTPHDEGTRQVTVASADAKAWLPATATTSQARSPSEQRFYLDDPGPSTTSMRTATAAVAPTITLDGLKDKISDIETEMAAGGTQEYRDCIKALYTAERETASSRKMHIEVTVESGLPRGTIVEPDVIIPDAGAEIAPAAGPPGSHEFWLEGPDSHLFESVYPSIQDENEASFTGRQVCGVLARTLT